MARSLGFARARRLQRGLGGGGSAPAWTPAQLTALRGWYRADSVSTSGSDITQMTDLSGAGNHLTDGGVSARRPALVANAINGQPVVSFDGVNEFLSVAFDWGASVGAHTFALVARITTYNALDRWVDYNGVIYIRSGATNVLQAIRASIATSVSTTVLGTTDYFSILYPWTGSSQSIYVDGSAEDTDANAGAAVASGNMLSLGGASGLNAAINVAEFVVMRAVMTADERAAWAAYVATRYGV